MNDTRRLRIRPLAYALAIGSLVGACASAPTVPPTSVPSISSSPAPTPASASPSVASPGASIAVPGSIAVVACPAQAASGSVCLSADGAAQGSVAHGLLTLSLTVRNPGSIASSAVSLLLHGAGTGPLPFGAPTCASCNTSTAPHSFGLEWPPLAPGETRSLTAQVPITAAGRTTTLLVDLYPESLVDLITNTTIKGIQPGQKGWIVSLTVAS
jgi:hypothetical protein